MTANANGSFIKPENCTKASSYAELEFWKHRTLAVSDGLHDLGGMRWELVGTVLAAWVICYLCIFNGTKSTGKSVYITSTFPLVMLLTLLVRGVTLPGAMTG
jgi:SNF family Na+-dependent transporter